MGDSSLLPDFCLCAVTRHRCTRLYRHTADIYRTPREVFSMILGSNEPVIVLEGTPITVHFADTLWIYVLTSLGVGWVLFDDITQVASLV